MKKFWIVFILVLALATGAAAETLKVGMECNYAPFNWTQTDASEDAVALPVGGYADGYDVQIAKIIAGELGMDLEIVKTEWDGLPLALTSGKIDAIIAGMSPTVERKMVIDFTEPYYASDLVVVVQKDGAFAAAKSLAELSGAKITGQLNTFHYSVIDQIPGVQKLTALETFPAMTVALSSGRIDGYVSERPGAVSAVAANPNLSFTVFDEGKGFVVDPENITVAVGVQKGSPLLEQINAILAGIDEATRIQIMDAAVLRQPLNQ